MLRKNNTANNLYLSAKSTVGMEITEKGLHEHFEELIAGDNKLDIQEFLN